MGESLRLDKLMADLSVGTRSEVKGYIRKGRVSVNGEIIKQPEYKVSDEDVAEFDGKELKHQRYEYYVLNKPAGIISASRNKKEKTVVDLIDSGRKDLFPVGRLDRDTEGLLLITNDGELAHNLLSPKKHVSKTYFAHVRGLVDNADVNAMAYGLMIDEEFTALPARLDIIKTEYLEEAYSDVMITIYEGKYHQIKRMFQALNKEVVYLKRISMGGLKLPDDLKTGEYIELGRDEIEKYLCLQ